MSRFREASFSGGNNASFARERQTGGSRPLGAGKGEIRSQMQGQGFSLRDRMAARRADKALAGATAATAPIGGQQPTTRPATGNILNQRQNLFKQMETSGAGGITPAMRSQARSLGVADNDFNTAADRVRTNQNYTPGAAAAPGAGATAATSAQPQKQPRRDSPPAPNPAMEKLYGRPSKADPQKLYGRPSKADPQKLGKMYANRPLPADIGKADVMPNKRK